MNLDSFTITALADEFRLSIMGGRVQQITQISPLSYGLELYAQGQRRYLHLSAEPQAPRVHLQSHKPRRGEGNQTPLYQLFRKYLKGSILMSVEQPLYERLLLFHFSGKEGESALVMELLGNRSNLLLLDPNKRILALARPAAGQSKGRRALLPNYPYALPPSQNKLNPLTLNQESLRSLVKSARPDKRISDALVGRLAGLSPFIAREIVALAYGQPELSIPQADEMEPLLAAVQQVYRRIPDHRWEPHIALDEDDSVKFFAPIPLTHLPRVKAVSTMSEGVERHFMTRLDRSSDGYAAARQPALKRIEKARSKLKRRLKKLDEDAAGLKDPDLYRQKGEAILTYSAQIRPRQTELQVEWLNDVIVLNPELSPSDNAQRYFARYKKAKRAAEIIPRQRTAISLKLDYLKQLTLDLDLAESRPEIDAVTAALRQAGLDSRRRAKKTQKPSPAPSLRKFTSPDGFIVRVGRNALDNHRLTFSRANPGDVWLHARGLPGAHVVISSAQGQPPRSTILWAAGIAAYYSKGRGENQVEVSYTLKRYVRAIKGAPPGMVTLRQEKTARVAPLKLE